MKTLDGEEFFIDEPTSINDNNLQYAEQKINYNIVHIMKKGTEDLILPLDDIDLTADQIEQHLNMIKRREFIDYIEHNEAKKVREVKLESTILSDKILIPQILDFAMIQINEIPDFQKIYFMTSAQESFAVCIIPISYEGQETLILQPLESTLPQIRDIWEKIKEEKENKNRFGDTPFVNPSNMKTKKKPNT